MPYRHTYLAAILLGIVAIDQTHPTPRSRFPLGGCRDTTAAATGFRLYLTAIDTSTADSNSVERISWHIPQVSASDISFVADSALCARGAIAHALSLKQDTANAASVYVLRVGPTRYVLFNYTRVGEWVHYAIVDSGFALLGARGG
jgi:hypothetical protein